MSNQPVPSPLAPAAPIPPQVAEIEFLRNQINWLTLTLLGIAHTLQMPADLMLRDLEGWAATQMAELSKLRG